jgi:L-alanine-DL-glutamate epimerase-like enolase superfamily enzyme
MEAMMKITAIKTFRAEEFSNVLWVHVETDQGVTGLGESTIRWQAGWWAVTRFI